MVHLKCLPRILSAELTLNILDLFCRSSVKLQMELITEWFHQRVASFYTIFPPIHLLFGQRRTACIKFSLSLFLHAPLNFSHVALKSALDQSALQKIGLQISNWCVFLHAKGWCGKSSKAKGKVGDNFFGDSEFICLKHSWEAAASSFEKLKIPPLVSWLLNFYCFLTCCFFNVLWIAEDNNKSSARSDTSSDYQRPQLDPCGFNQNYLSTLQAFIQLQCQPYINCFTHKSINSNTQFDNQHRFQIIVDHSTSAKLFDTELVRHLVRS
jgi:hypothetical protein